MPEPGIQHFLHAMQLGAPQIAHFVETPIDIFELRIEMNAQVVEPRIIDQNAHQDGKHVRHSGQGDSKELRIAHPLL